MSNIKEQIEALKEQRIQEIINDEILSKLEKLKLFSEENLFEIKTYIQDNRIFKEWGDELKEKVKEEDKSEFSHLRHIIIDTFISPSEYDFDRHSTLYLWNIEWILADVIGDIDEDYEGEVFDYPNPIPVITTRGSELTINKTPQEVLDKVYEWAILNKVCGYKIDW